MNVKMITRNVVATGCLLLAANVMAEEKAATPAPAPAPVEQKAPAMQPQQQPQMSMQQQFQMIQQQLKSVQNKALEQSPELQAQAEALDGMMAANFKEQGIDVEKEAARLTEIQQQASSAELSDDDQKKLGTEYREIQQRLMVARQTAMESEEIVKKGEAFRNALLEEMIKIEPQTQAMIGALQQIQQLSMQQAAGAKPEVKITQESK